MNSETPAAIIEWGATTEQRVITGTIAELPELARANHIEPPATIIIGDVVCLRDEGLRWFDENVDTLNTFRAMALPVDYGIPLAIG
ncbi:MAG: hypothetical protein CUN54_10810 [Phototrophicales bacterium]|nr:MAG: hypothetical protein CUN54_10810 [Phototrophicales bacterium]